MALLFGFYSGRQAEMIGSCFYDNTRGHEVEVTQVSEAQNGGPAFSDARCVGPIGKYLRPGKKGREDNYYHQENKLPVK